MTNSIGEVENSQLMFVIGSNTTETHPVISYRMRRAKKKGATLIVADPRRIELAEYADVFLQLLPGTNEALLNGMLHVIIEEGLVDKEFIQERTEGFAAVAETVKKYTPEYVETITGVAADDLRQAARLYGEAESAAIFYTMGITQHTKGTNNVLAVANLAMATGNLGKPSSGVNPLRGQNNVQGACDMGGLPNVITGYQKVGDSATMEKFEKSWSTKLNPEPGLTVPEIFSAVLQGEIKALYIMGENPAISDADLVQVHAALDKVDFLVVQDLFLTETACRADVVFPAAAFAEKDGTFVNTERRVQRVRKAIDPPGEAKPDWLILNELAAELGLNWKYDQAEDIFNEITRLTPSYAGISYQRLDREGGLQWPCPSPDHPGTRYLHQGQFTKGKGSFVPVEYRPSAESVDEDYPLLLTTGRNLYNYHTGTMTRHCDCIAEYKTEELIQVNYADAQDLGIADGDLVTVSSRRGSIEARVHVADIVPRGVIFMTFHFIEAAVNMLTGHALDPVSKTPELKVTAVRLAKKA